MSELGQRLIEIVRRKAAESPSYVYQHPNGGCACQYVHAETDDSPAVPGCLIGHALWEAGLVDSSLCFEPENENTFLSLADNLELDIDSDELSWLATVQLYQDRKINWGRAVVSVDMENS